MHSAELVELRAAFCGKPPCANCWSLVHGVRMKDNAPRRNLNRTWGQVALPPFRGSKVREIPVVAFLQCLPIQSFFLGERSPFVSLIGPRRAMELFYHVACIALGQAAALISVCGVSDQSGAR